MTLPFGKLVDVNNWLVSLLEVSLVDELTWPGETLPSLDAWLFAGIEITGPVAPELPDVLSFTEPLTGVGDELGSRKVTVFEDLTIEPAEFSVVYGITPIDSEQGQLTTRVVVMTTMDPWEFVVVSKLNAVDKEVPGVRLPVPKLAAEVVVGQGTTVVVVVT